MKKFLTTLLLTLLLVVVLTSCDVVKVEETEYNYGNRIANVDNTTLISQEGEWRVTGDGVTLDGKPVEIGDMDPSDDHPTISMIDECIYVHGEEGMERYSFTNKRMDKMYYDIMDVSFASLKSIYYINGSTLYKTQGVKETYVVDGNIVKDIYLLNDNYLYYISGEKLKSVDLLTEDVAVITNVTSPVTSIGVDGGKVVVRTTDGDVTVDK